VTTSPVRKTVDTLRWLPSYVWQKTQRPAPSPSSAHLIIALADHFEPSFTLNGLAPIDEQERRLERWCREYPKMAARARDSDGRPFRHTYFYPAEQYHGTLVERLADHCHQGWGEIEVHLHHGASKPDTADNTRQVLSEFRDALNNRGCLSKIDGVGLPRFAFVHGNWALANSARNRFCGVDEEMQILAEIGCYADLTLPSAPSRGQVAKINSLYECDLPLTVRAPHRRGHDLQKGRPPSIFPLIVQGPLGLRAQWPKPRIENGELTTTNPPTLERMRFWSSLSISVKGCPDWIFIKLHCHGMDPRDESFMYGNVIARFLADLTDSGRDRLAKAIHFVTAREMVNVMLAACDGREGNPSDYRDYRLRLTAPSRSV